MECREYQLNILSVPASKPMILCYNETVHESSFKRIHGKEDGMRTVITYGTFDLFHQGHYNILKRAKEEGDYLIVGVTGETYDAERGKLSVQDSLATRIENVKKTGFADKIIVEEYLGQKIHDIIKYHVDVLVIGSDWKGKFDHISKYCEIKYLERTKNISSTQLREQKLKIYNYGIVTNELEDSDSVLEPKVVSGIHVESSFSEDPETAKLFADRYEMNHGFTDYDAFLDSVDIVSIKVPREKRLAYLEDALNKGKHVICDLPVTMDPEKSRHLEKLAKEKGSVFFGNVLTIHQQAFGQLLWMARGNLIGDLISVKCSISKKVFAGESYYDFIDLAYYPVCAIVKILGFDYKDCTVNLVRNADGDITYGVITFSFDNTVAVCEISMDYETDCEMSILGTNGEIYVPEDWWRMGYFKYKNADDPRTKHYSSNFEGNGLRYLVQAFIQEIRSQNVDTYRITPEESAAILKVLNEVK